MNYNLTPEIVEEFVSRKTFDIEKVFGTTELLPKYEDVPEEFKTGKTKWNKLFSDCFFSGLTELDVTTKENYDPESAWQLVLAHMASFSPKHEHKEAGCAYMMSIMFEDVTWKRDS